jgi:hypothetical protein
VDLPSYFTRLHSESAATGKFVGNDRDALGLVQLPKVMGLEGRHGTGTLPESVDGCPNVCAVGTRAVIDCYNWSIGAAVEAKRATEALAPGCPS